MRREDAMQVPLLLHLGQRSVTLILDAPLGLPLVMATVAILASMPLWREHTKEPHRQ